MRSAFAFAGEQSVTAFQSSNVTRIGYIKVVHLAHTTRRALGRNYTLEEAILHDQRLMTDDKMINLIKYILHLKK